MASFSYHTLEHFKSTAGYTIDEQWYPRVTAIVAIKAKPALYRYYADQINFSAAQNKTMQSAKEGTLIHDTIEALLRGEQPLIPENIQPVINAFLEFQEQSSIEPLLIEQRVASKRHWYAGTVDLVAKVNGNIGAVDIKTSFAVFRDYNLQTSAYVEALKDSGFEKLERWILRLDQARFCISCGAKLRLKGGNAKIRGGDSKCFHRWGAMKGEVEFVQLKDFDQDIKAFLACKDLWEWEHERFLKQLTENSKA